MKETLNKQMEKALRSVINGINNQPEIRPQQIEMAQKIRRFLQFSQNSTGNTLMIEAGTGVGKSFAYLTALCEYIKTHIDAKAVIGTNTISLQEQLHQKDIPYVLKNYPGITAEKVKGRNNYLCLHKLSELDTDLFASEEIQDFASRIHEWLDTDHNGEKSNIPFEYENKFWRLIESDGTACIDIQCRYKKECYFFKARNKLKDSNIIIANHAIILADIKQKVLPDYDILVLDEGHNFETNALSALTDTITRNDFLGINATLNTRTLQSALRSARVLKKVEGIQNDLKNNANAFFESLENRRYTKPEENDHGERIISVLKQALVLLEKAEKNSNIPLVKAETAKLAERIEDMCQKTSAWLHQTSPNSVYWVENHSINCAPLDIASILPTFWQTKNTVITSATLTVNRSFNSMKRSLGLGENCYSLRYGSPFNYKENSIIYQPPNAPSPNSCDYSPYVCKTIESILNRKSGKTFVLFTSYKMMEEVYDQVHSEFPHLNWLLQGTGSKEMLLSKFRENDNSVLFGTDTFWEGVDEKLNCVIITKLPFEVPTTPIKEAQYELVKSRGGNSFMELSVPRCAIKLQQGTGRLIRNSHQKGIIVICDPRIHKPWGKIIKNTLPQMPWTDDLNLIDFYLSVG